MSVKRASRLNQILPTLPSLNAVHRQTRFSNSLLAAHVLHSLDDERKNNYSS